MINIITPYRSQSLRRLTYLIDKNKRCLYPIKTIQSGLFK